MDSLATAKSILEALGTESNVTSLVNCMTRLRVTVKDTALVKVEDIKKIKGVLGYIDGNPLQIVLGPGAVEKVAGELAKLTSLKVEVEDELEQLTKENKAQNKAQNKNVVTDFLAKVASIFVPLIPGIIAAGLLNGLCNVVNVSTQGAFATAWWFQFLRALGGGVFVALPVFVGMNAAKVWKGTPILGAMAGLLATGFATSATLGGKDVIMPFTEAAYNPGMGGMIAALLGGILFACIERQVKKVLPDSISTFFTPLLTVISGGLVMILVLQPVGTVVTKAIFSSLDFLYTQGGIFGGYLLSATFLPLVSVGLHQALTPIHVLLNNPEGPTKGINYLLPILMMAGGGQVGAGLAIYLKTKNQKLKQLTRNALPVGILGIGEPLMYAVTLPLLKPFVTACLGAGFGGVLAVLFNLGAVTVGVSGLFGALIVQPENMVNFFIAMFGAYIGGFVLTWLFGVDEKRIEEVYGED